MRAFKTPANVREAMKRLRDLDHSRRAFGSDPMSAYCGCSSDFSDDYDRQERKLAAYILKHSPKGSRRYEAAFGRLEAYMP